MLNKAFQNDVIQCTAVPSFELYCIMASLIFIGSSLNLPKAMIFFDLAGLIIDGSKSRTPQYGLLQDIYFISLVVIWVQLAPTSRESQIIIRNYQRAIKPSLPCLSFLQLPLSHGCGDFIHDLNRTCFHHQPGQPVRSPGQVPPRAFLHGVLLNRALTDTCTKLPVRR